MAKKKGTHWLPYEAARDYVQSFGITSRRGYWDWWKKEQPRIIPKYPYRVYTEEWVTWNEFLGTENMFNAPRPKYRPYLEAVAFVHKLRCKNRQEYVERKRAGDVPEDIPADPDWVYKHDFMGWSHWLGNRVMTMVGEQQRIAKETRVLVVGQKHDVPSNVIWIKDVVGGMSAAKEIAEKHQLKGFKVYQVDNDNWKQIVSNLTTKWWEDPTQFTSSNVNELLFELSTQYQCLQ